VREAKRTSVVSGFSRTVIPPEHPIDPAARSDFRLRAAECGRTRRSVMRKQVWGACIIAGILVSVSSAGVYGQAMKEKSLYDRLGGKKAITAVVDEFVSRVAADKRINEFFAQTASDEKRLKMFKGKLVDQICEASGGPCTYTGKDMKSAHIGMGIAGGDFDALVEDLVGALDTFKVGAHEKDQLLGALAPMKSDIVEKR
jgi:hemoglobin